MPQEFKISKGHAKRNHYRFLGHAFFMSDNNEACISTSLKEKECMPFICIEEKGHDLSLIEEVFKKRIKSKRIESQKLSVIDDRFDHWISMSGLI